MSTFSIHINCYIGEIIAVITSLFGLLKAVPKDYSKALECITDDLKLITKFHFRTFCL